MSDPCYQCQQCGRKPFIIASKKRLFALGLMPVRCIGCQSLIVPHLPAPQISKEEKGKIWLNKPEFGFIVDRQQPLSVHQASE